MATIKEECESALSEIVKKLQDSQPLNDEDVGLLLFARLMEEESNEHKN